MQSTGAGEAAAAAAAATTAAAAAAATPALPQSRDKQKEEENGSEQGPPAALWVQGDSECDRGRELGGWEGRVWQHRLSGKERQDLRGWEN